MAAGRLSAPAGFDAYLGIGRRFDSLPVTVGGGLVLMVWLYLVVIAILLGAEVNRLVRLPDLPQAGPVVERLSHNRR